MGMARPDPNSSAEVAALSFDLSESFLFGVKRFDFLWEATKVLQVVCSRNLILSSS